MPRKKKTIKATNAVESAVPQSSETSAEEQQKIVQFIDNIIKKNVAIEADKKKERLADYDNLIAVNSEWLDSFILMGYNLKGDEIVISKALNAKDYNSLLLLLKKAFINLFMKAEG